MIIPITLSSTSSSSSTSFSSSANPTLPPGLVKISNEEIMLIELQGSLEVESNEPSERNGKLVGKLKIDEATNKPTLLIGHHLLEGKIAALPKAYAILVRRTRGVGGTGVGGGGEGQGKGTLRDTDLTISANSDPADKSDRRRRKRRRTSQRSKDVAAASASASAGTDHPDPDPDDVGLMDVDPIPGHPPEEGPDFYGEEEEGSNDEDEDGPGSESSGAGTGAGWVIAGIVKKKIIFSKRPMPVTIKK